MSEQIDNGLNPTITTYTGIMFNITEPEFVLEDIAHALSNTCRYAGHCNQFYSVAEHSVLVSEIMEHLDLGNTMVGLMHDAHEAYLSDVPSPFKQLLPDWTALDNKLEEEMYKQFDLPYPRTDGCKEADTLAYFVEKMVLFKDWNSNLKYLEETYPGYEDKANSLLAAGLDVHAYDPWMAKKRFLDRYAKLQKQAGKE